jgi:hypothetical protein
MEVQATFAQAAPGSREYDIFSLGPLVMDIFGCSRLWRLHRTMHVLEFTPQSELWHQTVMLG